MRELHIRLMAIVARAAEEIGNTSVRLEGGTALSAYYLGHRESEDLDFFSDISVDARVFGDVIRRLGEAEGLTFEDAGPRSATFTRFVARDGGDPEELPVKIDLAAQSPFHLEPFEETTEHIRVGSLRDLAANKLHAVCDRFEVRDYIDLHVILTRDPITPENFEQVVRERTRELVRDVMEIDPGLHVRLVGDAISRGLGRPLVAPFPLRLLAPITDADLQQTLEISADECATLLAESMNTSG